MVQPIYGRMFTSLERSAALVAKKLCLVYIKPLNCCFSSIMGIMNDSMIAPYKRESSGYNVPASISINWYSSVPDHIRIASVNLCARQIGKRVFVFLIKVKERVEPPFLCVSCTLPYFDGKVHETFIILNDFFFIMDI